MDWEITDNLEVLVRYEFLTDDGTAWSVPLRPAAIDANCEEHKRAAFELARYEAIAERMIRHGEPPERVRKLLEDLTADVVGEVRTQLRAAG